MVLAFIHTFIFLFGLPRSLRDLENKWERLYVVASRYKDLKEMEMRHHAKWKKPDMKEQVLHNSVFMICSVKVNL